MVIFLIRDIKIGVSSVSNALDDFIENSSNYSSNRDDAEIQRLRKDPWALQDSYLVQLMIPMLLAYHVSSKRQREIF